MNKFFLFSLLVCLVSVRASNEDDSSPLMMIGEDHIVKKEQEQQKETQARARQGASTPPSEGLSVVVTPDPTRKTLGAFPSASTTRETMATSSPPPVREGDNDTNIYRQDNLETARAEIQEALEHCQSTSLYCTTAFDKRRIAALKELGTALLKASESPVDEDNQTSILSKIEAARKACKMEDPSGIVELPSAELEEQDLENRNVQDGQAILQNDPTAQYLEECQKIKFNILNTVMPLNHYDGFHPVRFIMTAATDGSAFLLLHPQWTFGIPVSTCIDAGLGANFFGGLAGSPYISSRLLAACPDSLHKAIRSGDASLRQHIDYDYLGYYVAGWWLLKLGTLPEVASFIVPSSLVRKRVSLFIQSERYQGPLIEQAKRLTSNNPMSAPKRALLGVAERFGPDLAAVMTRSFLSNCYDYHHGKITAEQVFIKTAFSATVYTFATFTFYSLYRMMELLPRATGYYQKLAAVDMGKIQQFKKALPEIFPIHNTDRFETQGGDPINNLGNHPLLKNAQVENLSQSLKLLDSPVTNLFGDPFHRLIFQNQTESFRAVDAIRLLRTMLPFLRSDDLGKRSEAYAALHNLREYLERNVNGLLNSENKIDCLINLIRKLSAQQRAQGEEGALLWQAQQGYNAVPRYEAL